MYLFRRRGKAALATLTAASLLGLGAASAPAGAVDLSAPDLKASSDTGVSSTDDKTNAATLVFTVSGAAEGETVKLLRDGSERTSGVAAAGGALELSDAPADGVYSYTLKRGDEAATSALVVDVDRTVDAAITTTPATPDLDAASDSGLSPTDNITNDKSPTFTLEAPPAAAAAVELLRGGASLANGALSGTYGTSATDATNPLDAVQNYSARFVDVYGNGGTASAALPVTIDSSHLLFMSLSSTSDTGRSSSDRYTTGLNAAAGNIYAEVVIVANTEAGRPVTWTRKDPLGTTVTLAPAPGLVPSVGSAGATVLTDILSIFAGQPPINGAWNYTMTQTDTAGNPGTATMKMIIDTVAPVAPLVDLDASSDTGSSNSDNVTQWNATGVNTSLKINVTGEQENEVDLFRDGQAITPAKFLVPGAIPDPNPGVVLPTGTIQFTDTGVPPYTLSAWHGMVAVATDKAGNSSSGNLPVYVDVNAPAAPLQLDLIAEDDKGPASDDNITNLPRPRFQVSGAEDGAIVELTACEGPGCSLVLSLAPFVQRSTRTANPPGSATTVVIGTTVGNGIIQPDDQWWTKTSVGQLDNYTAGNGPALPGNPANTSWRFNVRQRDLSGRLGATFSQDLNVVIDTKPLAKPSAPDLLASSDTGESDSDDRTGLVNPTFNVATASGRVELLRDGNPVATRTAAGEITDPGPLGNGAYTYTVRATDTAGNQSTSDPLTVVVENGNGYWLVGSDGGVFAFGGAGFFGSAGDLKLNAPILGIEATPKKNGYWLLSRDGGVFAFGDAGFFGSTGDQALNAPILGMVPTASGKGYWLFAPDGGVFAFGDAAFLGSPAEGGALSSPIVAMRAAPDGNGYWLIARNGKVYAFGSAAALRGLDGSALNAPIVGAAATPSGKGLWLVGADGGIFTLGDAVFHGSTGDLKLNSPIIALSPMPSGAGYWLLAGDGGVFTFGSATFLGSTGDQQLNKPIVGMAVL
jgi:hypothetical protein